jgi:nucleoside-diphosphate-sugar epimerase
MQTILGAGGVIGNELALNLTSYTKNIRLVSRNPKPVNETDEIYPADLTDKGQVVQALQGTDVAYLVAGLKYESKVWQALWPTIMSNTIQACKTCGAKLVFFDNVYMYGKVDGVMTEETPFLPCSRKGKVRAKIAQMLMDEINAGNLTALIARAADFYGPNVANSVPESTIIQNLKKGKKAQLFCSDKFVHSYTYTPDAGKATAMLGNTEKAYHQVWHLPTHKNPLTGKEWVDTFARSFNTSTDYIILKKWMLRLIGLFTPIIGELNEMLYQYDRDYIFDSTKFEKAFNYEPISYEEGIQKTVDAALKS